MKNVILAFLVFCSLSYHAQKDTYQQLKKIIGQSNPEISTDDKLLAFNVWSANDPKSREANKSFDKVYSVYEYAKLKGGARGVVVVAINKENLSGIATVAFTRDGIQKIISIGIENIDPAFLKMDNAVFDSSGNEVYKNLPAATVFNSFNQLITR